MIQVDQLSYRYTKRWIFRDFSAEFPAGEPVVLLGENGQGKSTGLQLLAGYLTPTSGRIIYPSPLEVQQMAFCAPALQLWNYCSVREQVELHHAFKPLRLSMDVFFAQMDFSAVVQRRLVGQLSSGMQQRLKLGLALFARADYVFLDEPCSHLDAYWIGQYKQWVRNCPARYIFIASNTPMEYDCLPVRRLTL